MLDLATMTIVTAVVVAVCGVLYIVDALVRRDEGPGRVWALAFVGAIITTLSYLVWATFDGGWWVIAIGNAAFVASSGAIWLGCRRFNARRMLVPTLVVTAMSLAAAVAVLVAGPSGGDWAGALWYFVPVAVFCGLGAVESLRRPLGAMSTSWSLALALFLQAGFYAARTVAFILGGPESRLFAETFGTVPASFVTIVLMIVLVVVASILRNSTTQPRGYAWLAGSNEDGIMNERAFRASLDDLVERCEWRGDLVGVVSVRVEDLGNISTAFGTEVAHAVAQGMRQGARRFAPPSALVGSDGVTGLLLAIHPQDAAAARRDASAIYRGLFEELGGITGGVIPVVGVGVGLSDAAGHDSGALIVMARAAAHRATTSIESSVVVGENQILATT